MRSHAYWCKAARLQGLYIRAVSLGPESRSGSRWDVLASHELIRPAQNSTRTPAAVPKTNNSVQKRGNSLDHRADFIDFYEAVDQ